MCSSDGFCALLARGGLGLLLIYGRVPLFFYLVHFWIYAVVRMFLELPGEGGPGALTLPQCIPVWLGVLFVLSFACVHYGRFKQSCSPESLWRFL